MNNKIKIGLSILIIISIILIVLKLKGEFLTNEPTSTCSPNDKIDPIKKNFLGNAFATFKSAGEYNPSYFSIDGIFKKKITDIKTNVETRLNYNLDKYLDKFMEKLTKNMIDVYKEAKIIEIPQKFPRLISADENFELSLDTDQMRRARPGNSEGSWRAVNFSWDRSGGTPMKWYDAGLRR
jgi:hypothetical protein